MMKTRQDNDLTDHIGIVYVENKTKLLWLIRLGATCDENQSNQLRDRLYRSGLCQKRNWNIMADRTRCLLWWELEKVNDIINHIDVIYAKNEIELQWPIKSSAVCDEIQTEEQRDRLYRCSLCRKWNWVIMINQTKCDLWWKPDKTTMWLIIQVWSTPKTILNCHDQSN